MPLLSEALATNGDIDALRGELRTYYASKADLVRWMAGLMVGASAAATGFAVLIERIT